MVDSNLYIVKGDRELDKNISNTLKGILIILIVIGHNSILTRSIDGLFEYLYSFHVMLFFILPWFYKRKPSNIHQTVNRSVKLYLYYIVFFILQVVLYNILIEHNFSLTESVYAFLRGGHHALKVVTGYEYLWFLPCFCISMIVYDIFCHLPKKGQIIFNILAIIVVLIFINIRYQGCNALIQGVYFASLGAVSVMLYNYVFRYLNKSVPMLLFVIMSLCVFIKPIQTTYVIYIVQFMPFIAFFALWNAGEWLSKRSKAFAAIGKLSLLIYLIHPLVFQFLIRVIPTLTNNQILYGIIILIATLVITIIASWVIDKMLSKLQRKNTIKLSKTE